MVGNLKQIARALTLVAMGFLWALVAGPASAAEPVHAVMLRVDYPGLLPISRLDLEPDDLGFAGAELATQDNQTTGAFLGLDFTLETAAAGVDTVEAEFSRLQAAGARVFVLDAGATEVAALLSIAAPDTLILNAGAPDVALRSGACHRNLLHVAPSRAMQADAVLQFAVWKKWTDLFLIHGSHGRDHALAEAYRRSARKFGARIVEEREFEDTGGARRTDTGHVLVQRQIPVFTQRAEDHDLIIAADETDVFAAYLPFHIWDPAPVAGSAGLRPLSWHPAHEAWGATQFQRRFEKMANRRMRAADYHAWLALRVIGEAASRTKSGDAMMLRDYAMSDAFELAAFKGQKVTFRAWNGQMRQPILLSDGRITVSVSPQDGFLHQRSPLDTLGLDAPESECTAFGNGG